MNNLPSLWPGEVASYDGATRLCRVRIPGITDGSGDLPEAVIMPSLGDRPQNGDSKKQTEIEMLAGDLVWLMFEGGDPRFPIIVGYRTPRAGNPTGWRRWHHANIEMSADGDFVVNCNRYIVNANVSAAVNAGTEATITAPTTTVNASAGAAVNSPATAINGGLGITSTANGGNGKVTMSGSIESTGTLKNNGVNVGSSHVHDDPQGGMVSTPH